jgi:hypothetical protein
VNIIFAVTQSQLALYQTLTELIDGAVVGELKQDSSNIVNLISQNYKVFDFFNLFNNLKIWLVFRKFHHL